MSSADHPRVVGVAGKCCAGKDLVTRWLLEHDWREINVDALGHRALEEKCNTILDTFGDSIRANNGGVDRKQLGQIVFADNDALRQLEAIVHPWMREQVQIAAEWWRNTADGDDVPEGRGLVVNAALLFHMQLDPLCDAVIYVRSAVWQRLRRARRRDGLPLKRILQRLWSQRHLDAQAHQSPADIITVENNRTPEALYARLAEIPQLR